MFDERFTPVIDTFIERAGIAAPPDDRVAVDHEPAGRTERDLRRAGIGTIIWATGYGLDYGWIAAPIFDERGYPSHVSPVPGMSFLGPGLDGPHLVTRAQRPARAF
jgi:putative flavoprotein involved in K+ transport